MRNREDKDDVVVNLVENQVARKAVNGPGTHAFKLRTNEVLGSSAEWVLPHSFIDCS